MMKMAMVMETKTKNQHPLEMTPPPPPRAGEDKGLGKGPGREGHARSCWLLGEGRNVNGRGETEGLTLCLFFSPSLSCLLSSSRAQPLALPPSLAPPPFHPPP